MENRRYWVFAAGNREWARCIMAPSSLKARQVVAAAFQRDVTDFYAVREDLLTPTERRTTETTDKEG